MHDSKGPCDVTLYLYFLDNIVQNLPRSLQVKVSRTCFCRFCMRVVLSMHDLKGPCGPFMVNFMGHTETLGASGPMAQPSQNTINPFSAVGNFNQLCKQRGSRWDSS